MVDWSKLITLKLNIETSVAGNSAEYLKLIHVMKYIWPFHDDHRTFKRRHRGTSIACISIYWPFKFWISHSILTCFFFCWAYLYVNNFKLPFKLSKLLSTSCNFFAINLNQVFNLKYWESPILIGSCVQISILQ